MKYLGTFLYCIFSVLLFPENSLAKYWGFEDIDFINNWNTSRVAHSSLITRSFDEELNSIISIISWTPNSYAGGFRTELADESLAPNETPIYYSFWIKIPKDFELREGDSCVIMQFHTPDSNHKPQLAFRARGNKRLDITINHKTAQSPEQAQKLQMRVAKLESFPRGRWQKVEMLILWSHAKGYFKININGVQVLRYKGKTNFLSQATGPYFKIGVYPAKNLPYSLSVSYGPYTYLENPNKSIVDRFE